MRPWVLTCACRDWQVQLPLCVLILLYMCPRTSIYVSWYYANLPLAARAVTEKYKCRPAGPDECFCGYFGFSGDSSMRTHILLLFTTTACVSAYCFTTICVLILLSSCYYIFAAALASHNAICVLILPYMCPRTTIHYMCVLVLLNVSSYYYTTIYVSSYCHSCVLMQPGQPGPHPARHWPLGCSFRMEPSWYFFLISFLDFIFFAPYAFCVQCSLPGNPPGRK